MSDGNPRFQQQTNPISLSTGQVEALLKALSTQSDAQAQRTAATAFLANPHARGCTLRINGDYDLSKNNVLQIFAIFRLTVMQEALESLVCLLAAMVRGKTPECTKRASLILTSGIFDKVIELAESTFLAQQRPSSKSKSDSNTAATSIQRSASLLKGCFQFLAAHVECMGDQAAKKFSGPPETTKGLAVVIAILNGFPEKVDLECCHGITSCIRQAAIRSHLRADMSQSGVLESLVDAIRSIACDEYKAQIQQDQEIVYGELIEYLASAVKNLIAHSATLQASLLEDAELMESILWLLRSRNKPQERIQILQMLSNIYCCKPSDEPACATDIAAELAKSLASIGAHEHKTAMQSAQMHKLNCMALRCLENMTSHSSNGKATAKIAETSLTQLLTIATNYTGAMNALELAQLAMRVIQNIALLEKPATVKAEICKIAQTLALEGGASLFAALFSMIMFSHNIPLQKQALSCIRNLCIDEASCSLILTMGMSKLLDLLYHGAQGIQLECLQIIHNLIIQHDPSFQEIYNSDGFIAEIVASLCSSQLETQACAIEFIRFCLDKVDVVASACNDLIEAGCLSALLVPAEERNQNSAAAAQCFEKLHEFEKKLNASGDPWTRIWKEWKEEDRIRAEKLAAVKKEREEQAAALKALKQAQLAAANNANKAKSRSANSSKSKPKAPSGTKRKSGGSSRSSKSPKSVRTSNRKRKA
eukprot:jgi/Hompol1/1940/HPOL_001412-RA